MEKVDQSGDCWLWTSSVKPAGYGEFYLMTGKVYAHRFAYEQFVGPIPDGMNIDHDCHNRDKTCPGGSDCIHRRCVRPDHLIPATTRENLERGRLGDKRGFQTHCIRGHEFTEENTYLYRGMRTCRKCKNDRQRVVRA